MTGRDPEVAVVFDDVHARAGHREIVDVVGAPVWYPKNVILVMSQV